MRQMRVLVAAVALVLSLEDVRAQSTFGRVEGVVRDSSGAVVPGVTLTLRNAGTGIEATGTTDDVGHYLFVNCNSGTYDLTGSLSGFKTLTKTGFPGRAGETARVDLA